MRYCIKYGIGAVAFVGYGNFFFVTTRLNY
jgi:hypothetical protein